MFPADGKGDIWSFCLNINLDPVWIEDEDGSEEETKEGRRGVDKPNCRSGLQLYFTLNFYLIIIRRLRAWEYKIWSGLHYFDKIESCWTFHSVQGDLQKFISGNNLFIFPNREVHLDEEATEDAALVRVRREEEEQAVAENGKGTKEPW